MLFFPISEFRRKRISNGVQTECNLRGRDFLTEPDPEDLECKPRSSRGGHEGGGRAHPYRARPLPRGAPVAPPTYPLHPYIPTYHKTSRIEPRSGVPPPQASVATKNQSGPYSGTLPEGDPITGGHLHHPGAIHDEEGVVHPWG